MATDSTHLPQGELNTDAGSDMAGNELEFGAVQLAQVTTDGGQPVQLPQGQRVVLIPVQPGQTLTLPTADAGGLLAKIGKEGNLSIVVDGRTIIFQGYVKANEQAPVHIVTTAGKEIDVADVVANTDPTLDIQTAAGPATGNQGEGEAGNGIFVPFQVGPGPGLINAEGVLGATALAYKLIDDERKLFVRDEEEGPGNIEITFDILGGVINEDDLRAEEIIERDQLSASLIAQPGGNDGQGNDPFDASDRDEGGLDSDGDDGSPDADREPLVTVATVKVAFGATPGTLEIFETDLPTGLKSEGEAITYEVLPASGGQGNGIVAFVDGPGGTAGVFDELFDRKVFDIKVQEDKSDGEFHVVFTLYDNIDNTPPDANGDGVADLLGANEQILDLPVKLTATDGNGVPVSAVMNLGVEDDVPFFGQAVEVGEGFIEIIPGDADITHDESWFPQGDADDQSIFDPSASGPAIDATTKVVDAGFSLPYGDSVGALIGIAQSQVVASFGADQATQEHLKNADDSSARNSVFGELEDRTNADGDNLKDGENERPFELFMIATGGGAGAVPAEDNRNTGAVEGNLTIADQKTNATVTWNGEVVQVLVHQIDAQTIVGYIIVDEPSSPEARAAFFDDVDTGKEAVFVLTIDDAGVMTFVQYHQINHLPNLDPTSHDESFQILGEDGTPIIQVRVTDYDGDHAVQPVDLQIQDSGPKVFCDFDCVTEGGDGDVLNFATGNVVTGNGNTIFGNDANFLDGNKDFPGVDEPHTISKLAHDGVTYFLNTPDVGDPFVTKGAPDGEPGSLPLNGTTETFDPLTGVLHIPTEKGGTLDIVLISDNLSEVGDYKYTVPESAAHESDDDHHVGPQSTAESRGAAFDTAGEWAGAFNLGGITLEAQVGGVTVPNGLAVKSVNVAGPDDYKGIGVGGGFAGEEVDTSGPESLKLTLQPGTFGAGVDNAKLTLGALFDGVQHDNGFQEVVLWQVFNNGALVASGQIVGDFDGLVTLDIDTNGSIFNEITLTPLSNGSFGDIKDNSDFVLFNFETCSPNDKFVEEFDYTLRDVDGDEATTKLKIGVEDTHPSIPQTSSGSYVYVDEDGLPAGIGNGDSPYDASATAASVSGFISFTAGADPVTIELSVGNGGDTGLDTVDGKNVFAAWDAESKTLIGYVEGTNPDDPANQVFKVVVTNEQTGAFDFFLLKPLEHSDLDQENGDNTENIIDLQLHINVQIEDQDCDVAYTTLSVVIDDDMPIVTALSGPLILAVDESLDDNDTTAGGNDVLPDPGTTREDDEDHFTMPQVLRDIGSRIGEAQADAAALFSFNAGADGLQSKAFSLDVTNGGVTGLFDTQTGFPIVLVKVGDIVEGQVDDGDPSTVNLIAFGFAISNSQATGGLVSMAQYRAVDHGDEEAAPGNHDEVTFMNPNILSVSLTVTDKDGDTVTASRDISSSISIDDDGPNADLISITVDPDGDGKLVHDETAGVQNNGDGSGAPDPQASGEDEDDVAGPLAAFSNLETSETLTAIGYAQTIIDVDLSGGTADPDKAFGTDGPGEAVLSLTKSDGSDFTGDLTNLTDTATGEPIFLYTELVNGEQLVIGRVGDGGVADDVGEVAFALSLNSDTGAFELAQYRGIDQLDPNAADESITLLAGGTDVPTGLVYATVVVTDEDGDSAKKSIVLDGQNGHPAIVFQDDLAVEDLKPVAYDDTVSVPEPTRNANLMLIFDVSGSMNDDSGVDDPNGPGTLTKLEAAKEAAKNMLTGYNDLGGDIRVMLVWFNSSGNREQAWLSVPQALLAIDAIPASNDNALTSYQDAITTAIAGFNDLDGRGDPATHEGIVYFLSDGVPTVDGNPNDNPDVDGLPNNGITPATLTEWNTLLEDNNNNVDHVYAVGFGSGIPDGTSNVHLNQVANPDNDAPADPTGSVLFVDDLADLEATLVDTIGNSGGVSGNILDGTIENDPDGTPGNDPDNPGDAPAHVSHFAYNGAGITNDITVDWDGLGALVIAGGSNVTFLGTDVSFDTDHGRMTFHFATGGFTFVPDNITGGDKHELFEYQITDNDGDVSNTATLDVHIIDAPAEISIGDVTVNEGGVANAVVSLTEPAPAGGITVNYSFQVGGGNPATAGVDYVVVTSSVFIAAGLTSANIVVNAANDAFFDDNETYQIVLGGVLPAGWIIADGIGDVTINDTTPVVAPIVPEDTQNPSGFLTSGESANNSNPWTGSDSTAVGSRDNVDLGDNNDVGNARAGHDHVEGGNGDDTLNGGDGNDYLEGQNNNDTLNGGNNDDLLEGGDGTDTLHGDAGNDLLLGGSGADNMFGDDGNDELFGGSGGDTLDGGANNDHLHAEDDNSLDKLFGGSGDDWLAVESNDLGAGRQIDGGSGNDVLDISGSDFDGSLGGVTNIEVINMEGGGNNDDVTLTAADVLSISGTGTLFIWGDGSGGADDDLQLSAADNWSQVADNLASNGRTYDVYQSGAATLIVDIGVDVVINP